MQEVAVEHDEVVTGVPVEVVVLHEVVGAAHGVEQDVLVPHETLIALLKLAQTGVGVVFPVEHDVLRAMPPPKA